MSQTEKCGMWSKYIDHKNMFLESKRGSVTTTDKVDLPSLICDKNSNAFLFKKWKDILFSYPVLFTVFKYSH